MWIRSADWADARTSETVRIVWTGKPSRDFCRTDDLKPVTEMDQEELAMTVEDRKSSLDELRRLTANLPPFPSAIERQPGFTRHKMSCGESMSFPLWNDDGISCARWFNSSGSVFPAHAHDQREFIIVVNGSMLFAREGEEESRYLPGQCAIIEPRVVHSARFLEDTWYLAVTVPACTDWPT